MNNRKGFTIIEVSLVLAIAGMIFMMAFLVLPGLWASERDAERRDDMIKFINNLKSFQTNNNRGALPENGTLPSGSSVVSVTWPIVGNTSATSWAGFYRDFLGENFTDPRGDNYKLQVVNCGKINPSSPCTDRKITEELANSTFPNDYNMYVVLGATCDGSTAIKSANNRKVAVLYRLERSNGTYCANS